MKVGDKLSLTAHKNAASARKSQSGVFVIQTYSPALPKSDKYIGQ